jgi:uncharacterized protein
MNTTTLPTEADVPLHIAQLWCYPVKSCAGVPLQRATLLETGLEWDRSWMVVDASGEFVSQRELPRMALIQPSFRMGQLVLRAPGMLALHLELEAAESPLRVRVWDDVIEAYDMGDVAAQWFSDFLGRPLRLARFDPEVKRLASFKWTDGLEAPFHFADGYPLLVTTAAALDDLNQHLARVGQGAVDMRRMRPNIVLGGLQAHDEDRLSHIYLQAGADGVRLQLVKPCARCSIPDVNPDTAATGHAVTDALMAYRRDSRLDGALTFGMNAIVRAGAEATLEVGQTGGGVWGVW